LKTLTLFILVLSAIGIAAQPPKGPAKPGTIYGSKVDAANAAEPATLMKVFSTPDTIAFKVKAKVGEVCSKKGCWMTFRINDTTEAFVKMKDYGFFVPVDLSGKNVVIQGKSFLKVTTVEELKHYAEDAKKPQSEVDEIVAPKKEVRIIADGILVTG
jgi:hypothetical protein